MLEADYGDCGFQFGLWLMRESYQGFLSRAYERASALCWEMTLMEGVGVKTAGRAAVGGGRDETVPAESENDSPPVGAVEAVGVGVRKTAMEGEESEQGFEVPVSWKRNEIPGVTRVAQVSEQIMSRLEFYTFQPRAS